MLVGIIVVLNGLDFLYFTKIQCIIVCINSLHHRVVATLKHQSQVFRLVMGWEFNWRNERVESHSGLKCSLVYAKNDGCCSPSLDIHGL